MNKDVLLGAIHAGRNRWEAGLAHLSPEQMTAPILFDGWSAKDLIAHVGAWERTAASVFAALLRGQPPGFDLDQSFSVDELNARFFAEYHTQSLDDVLAGEQAAYHVFLGQVEGASDDDLFDAGRFAWMQGDPFVDWVAANTYEHYDEHLADLASWLDR